MSETSSGFFPVGEQSGDVTILKTQAGKTPIRFPHIPARDNPPARSSGWLKSGPASVRVDESHPPIGERSTGNAAIPGLRSLRNEASGDDLVTTPLPSTNWPARSVQPESIPVGENQRPAYELLAMNDQLRRRLVDFGNLLNSVQPDNRQLESGYEVVCRSYAELSAEIRKFAEGPARANR